MQHKNLVLLPGLDGTGLLFEPFLHSLPSEYRARVVSYPSDQQANYQQLIPEIREVAPWDEPYILVAESFAGPLALHFAQAQWEYVEGIVLCASFVRNPLPTFLNWIHSLTGTAFFRKTPPPAVLKKYLLGKNSPPHLVDAVTSAIGSVEPPVLAQRLDLMIKTDATSVLQECSIPLCYLLPSQDELIGQRGWEEIRKVRPDIPCIEIDGPHLLLQTKPREAWTAIETFLGRLPGEQANSGTQAA